MAVSLADLIKPETRQEVLNALLNLYKLGDFPVLSWDVGSLPSRLSNAFAEVIADARNLVAKVAAGGFLDLIEDTEDGYLWLELVASGFYNVTPKPAQFTRGTVRLTDSLSAGPFNSLAARSLFVGTPGGLVYTNTAVVSIPLGGFNESTWEAITTGAKYNAPVGAITEFLTPLPGVKASNPSQTGLGDTWISQVGTDKEAMGSVKTRCRAKFPQNGYALTNLAVRGYALSVQEVTRVRVFPHESLDGRTRVILASDAGGVSGTAVAAVQALLDPKAPVGVAFDVASATVDARNVVGTLYVATSQLGTALGAALTELVKLQTAVDIGQIVYLAKLVDTLMNVPGATNLILTAPDVDIVTGPTSVVTFVPALSVQPA